MIKESFVKLKTKRLSKKELQQLSMLDSEAFVR